MAIALAVFGLAIGACDKSSRESAAVADSAKVLAEAKAKAEAGDVEAMIRLAKASDSGVDGTPKDEFEASKWYLRAAQVGDVNAMGKMGRRYSFGIGIRKDVSEARKWRNRAAAKGDATAVVMTVEEDVVGYLPSNPFNQFVVVNDGEPSVQSIVTSKVEALTRAAESGNVKAQTLLGRILRVGIRYSSGDTKHSRINIALKNDSANAVRWLIAASNAGDAEAKVRLAWWYDHGGEGIAIDKSKAASLWREIADIIDSDKQMEVAKGYYFTPYESYESWPALEHVNDPAASTKSAIEWLELASSQGNGSAARHLASILTDQKNPSVENGKIFKYQLQAAEAGFIDGQTAVALAYFYGRGVPKDLAQSFKWAMRAATHPTAAIEEMTSSQTRIAYQLAHGQGVANDFVLAYAWANVAASAGDPDAKRLLEFLEKTIDQKQLQEAQQISSAWKPGEEMKRLAPTGSDVATNPGTKPGSDIVPKLAMYGSGFLIDSRGTLVTNFHVGGKCKEIKVPALSSKGTLLAGDAANDLAVLKIESAPKNSVRLSTPSKIRQGQDIVVFGFPLEGYLPSAGNVTTGLITSLFGTNNNTSLIQISAPVQQGNSGGPVLDDKGDVVGVVSSKADAIRIAKATGDIVQNVNFAISLGTLQAFLDANRIEYQKPAYFAFTKKPDELAAEAREYTYKVECWR